MHLYLYADQTSGGRAPFGLRLTFLSRSWSRGSWSGYTPQHVRRANVGKQYSTVPHEPSAMWRARHPISAELQQFIFSLTKIMAPPIWSLNLQSTILQIRRRASSQSEDWNSVRCVLVLMRVGCVLGAACKRCRSRRYRAIHPSIVCVFLFHAVPRLRVLGPT